MNVICLVAIMILTMCSSTMATTPYTPASPNPFSEPWRWTTFPELKGHGLRCLTQTEDGVMWFGTDEGVWSYNGNAYQIYTPQDGLWGAPVYVLCTSKNGSLYAGTAQGISVFQDGKWTRLFPKDNDLPWPINALYETSDGTLWAGTGWGLLKVDTQAPQLFTSRPMAQAIQHLMPSVTTHEIPDPILPKRPYRPSVPEIAGVGLRAIEGSWASLRDRNQPRVISDIAPNGPASKAGLQIGDHIIAIDGTQPAWANDALKGAPNTPVTITIQRKNQSQPFDVTLTRDFIEGTFQECPIYTLIEDKDQVIWFALARNQMIRTPIRASQLDPTRTYQRFDPNNTEQFAYAPALLKTKDGTLWTVSQSTPMGLSQFDGQRWVEKSRPIIGTSIIQTQDGIIWVGGRQIFSYENGQMKASVLPANMPHNYIHLVEAKNGALWMGGTGEGVARFDYQTTRWQTFEDLAYFCSTPDNTQWFLNNRQKIVSKKNDIWQQWDTTDGTLEKTNYITVTPDGQLLSAGYEEGVLTTATFNGQTWHKTPHPTCNAIGHLRDLITAPDGSLLLYTQNSIGIFLQTPDGVWHHEIPPEAPAPPSTVTRTPNGEIWVGGWFGLRCYNPTTNSWQIITAHTGLTSYIDALHVDHKGHLWVGTRLYGIFHFDGQTWTQYNVADGIADINVSCIFSSSDHTIWASTRNGISRFDGQTWITNAIPLELAQLISGNYFYPSLSQTPNGTIWLNLRNSLTVAYHPDTRPPETQITTSIHYVSHPGNTTLSWTGTDPWKVTKNVNLQYAYRLNQEPWSPFTSKTSDIFLGLPSGDHTFEVRTRDEDLNIDPTPAKLLFTVAVPVWSQPWFILMVTLSCAAIIWQTRRIMQRNRQVQASHRALEIAMNDLQSSEERLRTVVTSAPVIFWAVDTQGSLTFLQGKEQDILGLAETDVLGESIFDLFAKTPDLCQDIQRALKGDAFFSVRELLGTTFEVHHAPMFNEENQQNGAIGVATNITDRVRSESERLRLNEEIRQLRYLYRLRVALSKARTPEEVISQAGEALLKTLSSAVSAHVCLTLDDRDWSFGQTVPPPSYHYHRALEWSNQTRGILAIETRVILTESQERALLDETSAQIVATLEARELEAQLLQSARLLSLGHMAAGVAHELNQPLSAISATAEGIYLRLESGMSVTRKRTMSMMDDILGWVDRMIGTIDSLRIFSRDSSQEHRQVFNINDVVRESIKMMNAQIQSLGIQLTLNLSPNLPQVLGHPHQMEQVLLNLLSNARDALSDTPNPEKHIFIRTYTPPTSQTDQEPVVPSNAQIILEVQDNGAGIDETHLPRLFEPFFTTKPVDKGTGIGLSIAFAIVQNHGGELTCTSQKGRQTTFRIALPIQEVTTNGKHRAKPAYSAR